MGINYQPQLVIPWISEPSTVSLYRSSHTFPRCLRFHWWLLGVPRDVVSTTQWKNIAPQIGEFPPFVGDKIKQYLKKKHLDKSSHAKSHKSKSLQSKKGNMPYKKGTSNNSKAYRCFFIHFHVPSLLSKVWCKRKLKSLNLFDYLLQQGSLTSPQIASFKQWEKSRNISETLDKNSHSLHKMSNMFFFEFSMSKSNISRSCNSCKKRPRQRLWVQAALGTPKSAKHRTCEFMMRSPSLEIAILTRPTSLCDFSTSCAIHLIISHHSSSEPMDHTGFVEN